MPASHSDNHGTEAHAPTGAKPEAAEVRSDGSARSQPVPPKDATP